MENDNLQVAEDTQNSGYQDDSQTCSRTVTDEEIALILLSILLPTLKFM